MHIAGYSTLSLQLIGILLWKSVRLPRMTCAVIKMMLRMSVTPCSNVSIKQGEDDKLRHQDTFPKENYSNTCMNSNKHGHPFQPFEIYVLCDKLRTGMGTALVDTGCQVSLVTEHCLNKGSVIKKQTKYTA